MDCEHPTGHHRCCFCGRFVSHASVAHTPGYGATGTCGCTGPTAISPAGIGCVPVTCEP